MIVYWLRQILLKITEFSVSLFFLVLIVFLFFKMLPGQHLEKDVVKNELIRQNLAQKLGSDLPLYVQVSRFFVYVVNGDLGESYTRPDVSVRELILKSFSSSAVLNFIVFALLYVLTITSSIVLQMYRSQSLQSVFFLTTNLFISTPPFLFAPLIILVFGLYLKLLPVAFLEHWYSYILPVVAMIARPWALLTRLLHATLEESRKLDFIRTAKAKGLSRMRTYGVHSMKYSIAGLLSLTPQMVVGVFSGSIIVETVFAIQGLGFLFVESIWQRDTPVIVAITFIYGFAYILLTTLTDFAHQFLDPRLREVR